MTACQLQLGESEQGFEIKSAVGDKMTGGVVNDWFLAAVTTTNMTNGALCLTRPQTLTSSYYETIYFYQDQSKIYDTESHVI